MADLRRAHPERFDQERGKRFRDAGSDPLFRLDTIIYLERLFARAAFEQARDGGGNLLGQQGLSRAECVEELASFYGVYGVADGVHSAEQMVRDIEVQAAAQAGRSRTRA